MEASEADAEGFNDTAGGPEAAFKLDMITKAINQQYDQECQTNLKSIITQKDIQELRDNENMHIRSPGPEESLNKAADVLLP